MVLFFLTFFLISSDTMLDNGNESGSSIYTK